MTIKGAQSVRLRRVYNVLVYNVQCDAVVFESQPPFKFYTTMKDLSKEAIKTALDESSGNRRRAAMQLDITERHLYRLLIKHELK